MSVEAKTTVELGCVAHLPSHHDVPMTVIRHYVLLRADSCDGVQRSFKIRQNDAMYNTLEAIVHRDTTGGININAFRIRIK